VKVCALSSPSQSAATLRLRLHPPPHGDRLTAALVGFSYSRQAEQVVVGCIDGPSQCGPPRGCTLGQAHRLPRDLSRCWPQVR
jgi:hypothetical protein